MTPVIFASLAMVFALSALATLLRILKDGAQ